jgi:DNA-binding CsgD family transcriptional regulator/tetratricopeptide (TPR) repeat protein
VVWGSVTGPRLFVGRENELATFRSVLGGNARLLLVVGDAGVGKTRFVAECLRLAEAERALSAWGACLPLAEKLPFLPVAEALDALSRLDDGAVLERALSVAPQYVRAEACRLLPQLQNVDAGEVGKQGGWQRERLFSGVAELLEAVARPAGLVLAMEDVHWADGATLDLMTFLARPGGGGVMLVATCRSDEVPVEPQVTRWLAHMRGAEQVAEIRLGPLSRDEVEQQVAGLMGRRPGAGVVDELYARAEGNPFFTEQLVAAAPPGPAGTGPGGPAEMPARLAELLAGRVAGCGDDARAVLAALAVAGRPLTEDQLGGVAGLGADALRAGLRELAAARLLGEATAGGACRVRHALLAEAVAGGLLPGERLMLHERAARALETVGQDALAAEAASHWAAAGRLAEELRARIAAARAAERVFGYAEAAAQWQRAVDLCQAGPATAAAGGIDLPVLYVQAMDAAYVAGDMERAGRLAEEAYRRFAGHPDPATAAVICQRAARFRGLRGIFSGRAESGSGLPLITEALRLFGQAPPSADHAEALFEYGNYFLLFGQGRHEDSRAALNQALEIAEAAGATALIPRILSVLASHELQSGQVGDGLALLARARALAEAARDGASIVLVDVFETNALMVMARFETAAAMALTGLQAARQAGLAGYWNTTILAVNAAESLLTAGRTAQAAALIDPLTEGHPDGDHWLAHQCRVEIDLLRGDLEAAARRRQQITALVGQVGNFEWSRESAQRAAELALWAGRPDEAVDAVRRTLALPDAPGWALVCGHLLNAGIWACADLAERGRARRDQDAVSAAARAGAELSSWVSRTAGAPFGDHPYVATIPVERATWDAEHARLAGAGDPAAWRAAAEAWQDIGWPHRAGYAWWRQAQTLIQAGQARAAGPALQAAAQAADGHMPLLQQIRTLAARARIPLPAAPAETAQTACRAQAPPPYGLTSREHAVLRLVAAGRTNAEIGAELFISPKTASVHVTSILRKLGVSGRAQAAAVAERAGLLGDQQA